MYKRRKLRKKKSRRLFAKTASRTHRKNLPSTIKGRVMRGGTRL